MRRDLRWNSGPGLCLWGVLLALAPAACNGGGPPSEGAVPKSPLEVSPDPIQLGTLKPGEKAGAVLKVRNPGTTPYAVDRIETSCPCVIAAPAQFRVEPGGTAELKVSFDPAEEPDFRGSLGVSLSGLGADGQLLFRSRVDLTVNK